jgi:hypothetical protein
MPEVHRIALFPHTWRTSKAGPKLLVPSGRYDSRDGDLLLLRQVARSIPQSKLERVGLAPARGGARIGGVGKPQTTHLRQLGASFNYPSSSFNW